MKVGGTFDCTDNKLTSLKYAPKSVGNTFNCGNNSIKSLEGAPEYVGCNFYCYASPYLTSLKGCPQTINGEFYCSRNPKLISLEGAPKIVSGNFICQDVPLTQYEVDKIVRIKIKGKITVPEGLKAPTTKDRKLYKKLGDKKYFKLKELKSKL